MRSQHLYHKIQLEKDSKYDSELIARLINLVMQRGKKNVARKIVYFALEKLSEKTKKPADESLAQIIENVGPLLEVRGRKSAAPIIKFRLKFRKNAASIWRCVG